MALGLLYHQLKGDKKLKRILLIEDDINYSKVLTYHINEEGHRVHCCTTGNLALDYLRRGTVVDLIILDLQLPDVHGLRLMEKIKSVTDTPIVINSANAELKNDFASWLADAYLVKQGDFNLIKMTINKILSYKNKIL